MKTTKNENCYPMLVSEKSNQKDSEKDFLDKWSKFDKLSPKLRDLLASNELAMLIEFIAKRLNLANEQIADLSRLIRRLFFRELSEEAFSREVSKLFGVSESVGKIIINAIKKLKISNKSVVINKPKTEKLSILEAMDKYEEVANEIVTSDFLIFPDEDKKYVPTVKNWLDLYDLTVGAGKHTSVDRGKFLYSSKNCASLPKEDKNKVSQLLNSRDTGVKLDISLDDHSIIWSEDESDLNDYNALVSQIKPVKRKITSISNLKGVKSSNKTISPQHFSKIKGNKSI